MNLPNNLYLFAVASLLTVYSPSALATYCSNGATNYPKCNNNVPPPPPPAPAPTPAPTNNQLESHNKNNTASSAASTAAARLKADLKNQQQQAQKQAQQQSLQSSQALQNDQSLDGSGNSSNTIGGDSTRSSMWVLPSPVFTPPLPVIAGCPSANVDQMAFAAGWNFISYADASINTDNCTAVILYNQYVATCKWHSAQQVLDLLSKKVLPGFTPSSVELVDLDKRQCDALLAPPVEVPPVINYISNYYQNNPQEKPAKKNQSKAIPTGPCDKPGWKRNSKGVCYKPCPCNEKPKKS